MNEQNTFEQHSILSDGDPTITLSNSPAQQTLATDRFSTLKPTEELIAEATGKKRYILGEEISRGGMGAIIRAADRDLRRDVALKVVLDEKEFTHKEHGKGTDPEELHARKLVRFIEEAQITGQLEHPGIVPVHEMGTTETGALYFSMKMIKGEHFGKTIIRSQQQDIPHLLRIFISACNAVAFAHSQGVIHRDLKPDNIMIGDYGEVLVIDWGLAKIFIDPTEHDSSLASPKPTIETLRSDHHTALTMTGQVLGTAAYMPPEQASGHMDQLDHRSDIYSLGAILYVLLCQRLPYQGKNIYEILDKVRKGQLEPPSSRNPHRAVSPELEAICLKSMSMLPRHRYQSVLELRDDITKYLAGYAVSAKQDSFIDSIKKMIQRNRTVSITAGIAAAILCFVIAVSLQSTISSRQLSEEESKRAAFALQQFEQAQNKRHALEKQDKEENTRRWRYAWSEDFSHHSFIERWTASSGWKKNKNIPQEKLLAISTTTKQGTRFIEDSNLFMLKSTTLCNDDVQVSYDATWHGGEDGGFHVCLQGNNWDNGYIFQIGGYNNSIACIMRGKSLTRLTEVPFILHKDKRYTIQASVKREDHLVTLELSIDGKKILSARDTQPLTIHSGKSNVVFFGQKNETTLHNLIVQTWDLPLKSDLLLTAKRHHDRGHYQTALRLYEEVLSSPGTEKRKNEARIGLQQVSLLAEKKMQHRVSREMISYWTDMLKKQWPNAFVRLEFSDGLLSCSLGRSEKLTDLCCLQNIPIDQLYLFHAPLQDLSPIKNLRLTKFYCRDTLVDDLTPLRDMPLEWVYIQHNPQLRSLKGLEQAPVNHLACAYNQLTDIDPLLNMPLTYLDCTGNPIKSIEVLRGKQIEKLWVGWTEITDISPLKNMPITHLECQYLDLTDHSVFTSLPTVQTLYCVGSGLKNCDTLAHMQHLSVAHLGANPLTNITGLADLPIQKIWLSYTLVDDISPLKNAPLKSITIRGAPIVHIDIFEGKQIERFHASYSKITSLKALANAPIKDLNCDHTDIYNLAGLENNVSLKNLSCQGTAITSIHELAHCKELTTVNISQSHVSTIETLLKLPAVKNIYCWHTPIESDHPKVINLRNSNKTDIFEYDNHFYAFVPEAQTWAQAQKYAEERNAYLFCPNTTDEEKTIDTALLPAHIHHWLGWYAPHNERIHTFDKSNNIGDLSRYWDRIKRWNHPHETATISRLFYAQAPGSHFVIPVDNRKKLPFVIEWEHKP